MPRRSDPDKARLWQLRLRRFHKAGLSVADFCAREGVSVPSFYCWKRRCQKAEPATTCPPAQPTAADFVPVRLVAPGSALELVLPAGLVLRVGPECAPALLRQVLGLLGVEAC
jgi:hypothetical protein